MSSKVSRVGGGTTSELRMAAPGSQSQKILSRVETAQVSMPVSITDSRMAIERPLISILSFYR